MATTQVGVGTGAILLPCRAYVRTVHGGPWRKYARKYAGCGSPRWRWLLMAYSLHEDNLGRDPRWVVLARVEEPDGPDVLEMTPARRRAHLAKLERRKRDLLTSHYLMTLETSCHKDDGYLTLEAALACCGGEAWQVKALATAVLGKPPFLHRKGESCSAKNCIDSSPPWPGGFDFRLCGFLKRNPSKAEQERKKGHDAELKDPRLRAIVLERDGRFCRYCRSGPLSEKAVRAIERRKVFHKDHPDPDKLAGPNAENLVAACASCDEHKGAKTPFEADMVLLDPPTPEQIAEWTEQGLTMFPPPWIVPAINNRISDESPPDHRSTTDPISDPDGDPDGDNATPDQAQTRPETCPEQPDQLIDQHQEGFASGRVGHRPDGGLGVLGQPVRDASNPDIYHGRSRAPAGHDPPGGDP